MFKRTKKVAGKLRTGIERGMGLPILMNAAYFIKDTARGIFTPTKVEQRETFDQARSRLNLSDADLVKLRSRYLKQCWAFLIFAVFVLAYSFYLFFEAAYASGVVSLLITAVIVVYALRAHFWAFQIKNHKLGCTWKEWWDNQISDEPKTDSSLQSKK